MKANRAFFSGIAGGIVISIVMAILRGLDVSSLNFEMDLGSLTIAPGMNAWITGFFLHLFIAGVFALIYGEFFEVIRKAGAKWGLLVGVAQAVVVGILMGILPLFRVDVGAPVRNPGFFAVNYGAWDVVVLFAVHLLFGVIVGTLYATPLHAGARDYVKV